MPGGGLREKGTPAQAAQQKGKRACSAFPKPFLLGNKGGLKGKQTELAEERPHPQPQPQPQPLVEQGKGKDIRFDGFFTLRSLFDRESQEALDRRAEHLENSQDWTVFGAAENPYQDEDVNSVPLGTRSSASAGRGAIWRAGKGTKP